jgi:hypothetical protein
MANRINCYGSITLIPQDFLTTHGEKDEGLVCTINLLDAFKIFHHSYCRPVGPFFRYAQPILIIGLELESTIRKPDLRSQQDVRLRCF